MHEIKLALAARRSEYTEMPGGISGSVPGKLEDAATVPF
jgi:hypothetical protein